MVSVKLFFLCILYFALEAKCGKVTFIDPCKAGDATCLLKSAKKALPDVIAGTPPLQPIEPIKFDTVESSTPDLKLVFENLNIEGISKANLVNIVHDLTKSNIFLEVETPFTATGTYKGDGKVAFVDVQGNGDCQISCEKLKISAKIKIKEVDGSDGQKHWEASRRSVQLQPLGKTQLIFKNLYNGNEEKAKAFQAILDSSSDELLIQFGGPIVNKVVDNICHNLNNNLFSVAPISELQLS